MFDIVKYMYKSVLLNISLFKEHKFGKRSYDLNSDTPKRQKKINNGLGFQYFVDFNISEKWNAFICFWNIVRLEFF